MSSKFPVTDAGPSITPLLYRALHRIRSTPPRIIASPATQPRRAAVALIIRVVPPPSRPPPPQQRPPTLAEFFEQDWVKDPNSRAELLFLRREKQGLSGPAQHEKTLSPASEAHVAFPGGRTEEGDEGGLYTAMRQTWEEIGIDLAERDYECIGQLDDREITTSLGKRLLMVLSPFVFLQLSHSAPPPDPAPATTLHWVPLGSLVGGIRWSSVTVDASTRLAPRQSSALKLLIRILVGDMKFPAITLDAAASHDATGTHVPANLLDEKRAHLEGGSLPSKGRRSRTTREELKLWGLSLGMTLDLVAAMSGPTPLTLPDQDDVMLSIGLEPGPGVIPPSLTSVFPRFAYPDVNFWIWVFGKRYREVVRGWEVSMRTGGTNDRRINWTGSALNTFYAAVRKALVVVIVARALGVLFGFALSGWWIFFR